MYIPPKRCSRRHQETPPQPQPQSSVHSSLPYKFCNIHPTVLQLGSIDSYGPGDHVSVSSRVDGPFSAAQLALIEQVRRPASIHRFLPSYSIQRLE